MKVIQELKQEAPKGVPRNFSIEKFTRGKDFEIQELETRIEELEAKL